MAVITRQEILKLLDDGRLRIKPFDKIQVGPGSIDLHLGNSFRVFTKTHDIFHVKDDSDYRRITQRVEIRKGGYFLIMPGELVHGITEEVVSLPDTVSARIEGRSRFARVGLLTHVSSGFIQPGTSAKVVLEIANLSPIPLALYPGTGICQIILEEVKGRERYKGRFHKQVRP